MSSPAAVRLIIRAGRSALGMTMIVASGGASAQTPTQVAFVPGGQELFALDLARAPIGGFRTTLELPKGTVTPLSGAMGLVIKDGRPMLRATERSELLITLPIGQLLPQNFTIEVDLIPRDGGPEPDLRLEGTRSINQGAGSAHLEVMADATFGTIYIIGGESSISEFPIPDDVRVTMPETFTRVGVSVEGGTIRFFINGSEILPDPDQPAKKVQARFARGNVLRVTLGGVTDGNVISPVYLARVRLATGAPVTVATALPATTTGTITPLPTAQPTLTTPTRSGAVASGPVARTSPGAPRGTTALAPPTGLTVTGTPAMATLSWQAPSGWTPTGYTVQRTSAGSPQSTLLTTSALRATRFDDLSGFVTGSSYEYVVTALSSDPLAFGTAQATFQPPAPQNVSNVIAQQAGSDVGVSWAPVPNATRYVVTSSSPAMNREIPGTQNRVAYAGVTPGTYTWTVGARYDPGPVETPAATWPSVKLDVLDPNPVLAEKKLYKEVSRPEIYLLLDGKKIHIPTPDALRFMGHSFADVAVVIDGALNGRKLFQFATGSPTPGSLLFPPKEEYAPVRIPAATRVLTQGLETRIVELRGWLRWTEKLDGCDGEGDVKYGLEVDSEWAVRQGIDLHTILKAGNLTTGDVLPGSTPRRAMMVPHIQLELNSFTWKNRYPWSATPQRPADWQFARGCSEGTRYYPFDIGLPQVDLSSVPDIYANTANHALKPYVRVVGALVTDSPHTYNDWDWSTWWSRHMKSPLASGEDEKRGAMLDWDPTIDPLNDPEHRHNARWTEIHPPDLIEKVTRDAALARVTLMGVGLVARSYECEAAVFQLAPEAPRPTPTSVVAWEELRGPETFWAAGQNDQNGSWVTDLGDRISVRAQVCGSMAGAPPGPLRGSPGRFKAFYRVWWK